MEVNSVWSDMKYLLISSHVNYIVSIKCVHHVEWKYLRLAVELRVLYRFACFWDIGLFLHSKGIVVRGAVCPSVYSVVSLCTSGCPLMVRQINQNILCTWLVFKFSYCHEPEPYYYNQVEWHNHIPDNKAHEANMGPIWGQQDMVGPMLAPWTLLSGMLITLWYSVIVKSITKWQ